ncbi:alpha/beta hydrolase [Kribbella sp. NBC_01245]|uniref:alpha/beta hydrolase family protein n=1 Tax=Kribbella sp. NBC_01245 TaxID=2903578 RepID=UPI002E2CBC1C|nr:alpha/beta hydrolase [Kribbella sp. NBC_01245]
MTITSEIQVDGRPALLTVPADGPVRAGVVALHGSGNPSHAQPIFEHLAQVAAPLGYAVLSFERAAWDADDVDVPFTVQTAGAVTAYQRLQSRYDVPIGFWGVSQGTWIEAMASLELPDVAFLVMLGCSGVSPAEQMRHATAELMRRNGYDAEAVAEAVGVRDAVAELLRGKADRAEVDALLLAKSVEPWFELTGLPVDLGSPLPVWHEVDFDSEALYSQVTCPVLLIHGAEEENLPVPETLAVWKRAAEISGNKSVETALIPGVGHWPGTPSRTLEGISPAYGDILRSYLAAKLP